MVTVSISTSREAWNLLRGITCLYKPPGVSSRAVYEDMKEKLTIDLNQLKREHEISPPKGMINDLKPTSCDYSLHPLVLGDGFQKEDIRVDSSLHHAFPISGTSNQIKF